MSKMNFRDKLMICCFTAFMAVFVAGEILFVFDIVEMTNVTLWIWRAIALPSAAGVVVTTITPIWNWINRAFNK